MSSEGSPRTSRRTSSRRVVADSARQSAQQATDTSVRPPKKKKFKNKVRETNDSQKFIPLLILLSFLIFLTILFGGYWFYDESRGIRRETRQLIHMVRETKVFLTGGDEINVNQTIYTYLAQQAQQHAHPANNQTAGTGAAVSDYGYSRGHLRAAVRLASTLNTTVNPCNDFYEFACGTWTKENPIPDHLGGFNIFQEIGDEVLALVEKLMQPTAPSSSKAIEKMRLLYKSCLVESSYNEEALQRSLALIKRVGPFPMLEEQPINRDSLNRMDFFASVLQENVGIGFYSLGLKRDMKNVTRRIVEFNVGSPPLYRDVWLNESTFQKEQAAYRQYLKDMLTTFAQDMKLPISPELDKQIDGLFVMYTKMAKIMIPPGEDHNITAQYNMEKFSGLVERFEKKSGLDLRRLHKARYNDPKYQEFLMDEDLVVNVPFPRVVDQVAELIRDTPTDVLLNDHLLSAFLRYSSYFPEKYNDIDMEAEKVISGKKAKTPRWKRCAGLAQGLRDAYSANYVRKHFSQKTKEALEDLVADLKTSFGEIVDEAGWMDQQTKRIAKKKIKEMLVKIGYDPKAFDDEKLDKYYEDWQIDGDMNFMEMYDRVMGFYKNKYLTIFFGPFDRHEFGVLATDVNAFASKNKNSILFTAAILRPPLFDRDYPAALNYGSIGVAIGHEITHNFDDGGRLYDEIGNLNYWWTESTGKKYDEKAQCMIDQYSAVEIEGLDGLKVNGKMTIGEDIADNGGVREAYRAYQKYLKKNGREKMVPGYPLTNEQLFWIGYGQVWCGNVRPQEEKRRALSDDHSPGKVRTNVVVSNQPEFARAFNCPRGSPMNPDKKCSVW